MKSFIVALAIFGCAYAAALDKDAAILRSEYDLTPEGQFGYQYETENGISGQASGVVKPIDKETVALEVTGSNVYKSPEGEVISVTYVANENGYQPSGAHLPTPPAPEPIPDYIQKSLDWIAAHPYVEKKL